MTSGRDYPIETVLDCLNATRTRATYGAVGAVIGEHPRNVKHHLEGVCERNSWIVRKDTSTPGWPGYEGMLPSDFLDNPVIVADAALQDHLRQWAPSEHGMTEV